MHCLRVGLARNRAGRFVQRSTAPAMPERLSRLEKPAALDRTRSLLRVTATEGDKLFESAAELRRNGMACVAGESRRRVRAVSGRPAPLCLRQSGAEMRSLAEASRKLWRPPAKTSPIRYAHRHWARRDIRPPPVDVADSTSRAIAKRLDGLCAAARVSTSTATRTRYYPRPTTGDALGRAAYPAPDFRGPGHSPAVSIRWHAVSRPPSARRGAVTVCL